MLTHLELLSALGAGWGELTKCEMLVLLLLLLLLYSDMVLFQPNSNINTSKVLAMYRKDPFTIHASYATPEYTPTGRPEIGLLSTAALCSWQLGSTCVVLCGDEVGEV